MAGPEADRRGTPESVVVEGQTLQVVEAMEDGRGHRGQSHSSQHKAVEPRKRQEVLVLQAQDGVLPNHQDLQRWQRLKPLTVDGY